MSNAERDELHKLRLEVAEMESVGLWKWLAFDPAQLSWWLRARRVRIMELQSKLELGL